MQIILSLQLTVTNSAIQIVYNNLYTIPTAFYLCYTHGDPVATLPYSAQFIPSNTINPTAHEYLLQTYKIEKCNAAQTQASSIYYNIKQKAYTMIIAPGTLQPFNQQFNTDLAQQRLILTQIMHRNKLIQSLSGGFSFEPSIEAFTSQFISDTFFRPRINELLTLFSILEPLNIVGVSALEQQFHMYYFDISFVNFDLDKLQNIKTALYNVLVAQMPLYSGQLSKSYNIFLNYLNEEIFHFVTTAFDAVFAAEINGILATNQYKQMITTSYVFANGVTIIAGTANTRRYPTISIRDQLVFNGGTTTVISYSYPACAVLSLRVQFYASAVVQLMNIDEIEMMTAGTVSGVQHVAGDRIPVGGQLPTLSGTVFLLINGNRVICVDGKVESMQDFYLYQQLVLQPTCIACPVLFNGWGCKSATGSFSVPVISVVQSSITGQHIQITANIDGQLVTGSMPVCKDADYLEFNSSFFGFTTTTVVDVRKVQKCSMQTTFQISSGKLLEINSTADQVWVNMPNNRFFVQFAPTGQDLVQLQGLVDDDVEIIERIGNFSNKAILRFSAVDGQHVFNFGQPDTSTLQLNSKLLPFDRQENNQKGKQQIQTVNSLLFTICVSIILSALGFLTISCILTKQIVKLPDIKLKQKLTPLKEMQKK